MSDHIVSELQGTEPDSEGWYWAHCRCGWRMGPLPDQEMMVGDLMMMMADNDPEATVASLEKMMLNIRQQEVGIQ